MALSAAKVSTSPMSFDVDPEEESEKIEQKQRLWDWLKERLRGEEQLASAFQKQDTPPPTPTKTGLGKRLSRKVGSVGIPRSTTFKRRDEEQRKNLEPVQPTVKERRDVSRVRQRALSAQPIPPRPPRRKKSAPEVGHLRDAFPSIDGRILDDPFRERHSSPREELPPPPPPPPPPQPPPRVLESQDDEAAISEASCDDGIDEDIREELEKKWILNLSMHFRDKTPREKFFLTYAETPQKWRRVTVSCDYRESPPDSLESDLQSLHSQRDKSARIYESIRMSLPDIQFYDTVTNLKLETKDDRLHVHVTEDVNESIPYPSYAAVKHLNAKVIEESKLHFVEHMSGFVYRVDVGKHTWIKKEIPGPDSVDEFLYEITALKNLVHAKNVIELKGLVVNDERTLVKGLLIAYAEKNALVDILYDDRGRLPWSRREHWAKDIVHGLSEIHEAGFVQGDFTLSNIVIDGRDTAKIIDINRRGCPVGWEPPEIAKLIQNGQRISMFIGVKSDLFQLGMVLWALAMEEDEPDRQPRPLAWTNAGDDIPNYYRELTAMCLNSSPAARPSAKDLLQKFPFFPDEKVSPGLLESIGQHPSLLPGTAYDMAQEIDFGCMSDTKPGDAKGIELIPESESGIVRSDFWDVSTQGNANDYGSQIKSEEREISPTLDRIKNTDLAAEAEDITTMHSQTHQQRSSRELSLDTSDSKIVSRGRTPTKNKGHLSMSSANSPARSEDENEPQIVSVSPTGDHKWEEITMNGTPYLVHRDTLESLDESDFGDGPMLKATHPARMVNELGREFEHIDSGLADMDLTGIGPGGGGGGGGGLIDLAAVDSHDTATSKQQQQRRKADPAKGYTDDLGIEHDDRNVDMGL